MLSLCEDVRVLWIHVVSKPLACVHTQRLHTIFYILLFVLVNIVNDVRHLPFRLLICVVDKVAQIFHLASLIFMRIFHFKRSQFIQFAVNLHFYLILTDFLLNILLLFSAIEQVVFLVSVLHLIRSVHFYFNPS